MPADFIDQVDLEAIAHRVGTPFYLYDAATLRQRIADVRSIAAGDGVQARYAMKACSLRRVLEVMRDAGRGRRPHDVQVERRRHHGDHRVEPRLADHRPVVGVGLGAERPHRVQLPRVASRHRHQPQVGQIGGDVTRVAHPVLPQPDEADPLDAPRLHGRVP